VTGYRVAEEMLEAAQVRPVLNGMRLRHSFIPAGSARRRSEALADPDDITVLGHHLYTAFQNGVGPQGEPSADGNTASTVVEFTAAGQVIRQWDIRGKCDGLTADTAAHLVIATVPQPGYPAAYSVTFNGASHVATVVPLFSDEAAAVVANLGADHGKVVRLALTDPDSNEIVPASGPRFGGDFMVTSQGDKEQIFLRDGRLTVLRLSQSVDDTAWAQSPSGRIFGASTSGDAIDEVTGRFPPRSIFVAVTPCDAANAPATCPAPGFPSNYLGQLDPRTGHITRVPVTGPAFEPQGMVFVSPGWVVAPGRPARIAPRRG
jgi:hypothetical protein